VLVVVRNGNEVGDEVRTAVIRLVQSLVLVENPSHEMGSIALCSSHQELDLPGVSFWVAGWPCRGHLVRRFLNLARGSLLDCLVVPNLSEDCA
jgi:hypothetical protein